MGLDKLLLKALQMDEFALLKAENPEAYKKLAEQGLMVGFPVRIKGQEKRPDIGLPYHSSIKLFNPDKDSPAAIHEVARNLKLNPPDPKHTKIEPGVLKDRLGNDVHVIKLHGPHAEAIKEHNKKFSHMGYPANFEYQPHISVDKATWDKIKNSKAKTAHEAGIDFGHAQLRQGHKVLQDYGNKETSKQENLGPIKKSENLDLTSDSLSNDEDSHALLNRQEDKYFLDRHNLEQVIVTISERLALGDIDTDTRYNTNRTIYLDNKDLAIFHDCIVKKKPRMKVRIRQYSPNSKGWEEVAYAEFKMKEEDGFTKKIRVRIPAIVVDSLSNGGQIPLDENLVNINKDIERKMLEARVQAINSAITRQGLKKQLEVRYERRAYTGKNLRITIDENLRYTGAADVSLEIKKSLEEDKDWKKFSEPYILASWQNPVIMEIKSDGDVPNWLHSLLKEVHVKKASFSKYSAAMVNYFRTDQKEGNILSVFDDLKVEPKAENARIEKSEFLAKSEKEVDIAVVLLKEGNFILVGKRRKNKKWGLPGGRNEGDGESNKAAALRELEEETGLKLKAEDLSLSGVREIKAGGEKKHVHIYTAEFPGGEPTTKEDPDKEFTKWRWIRCEDGQLPDEILEAELNPPAEAAFDELNMTKNESLEPLMKSYSSEAQRRCAHTQAGKKALGGKAAVHEWDEATKGKKLPEKLEKGKIKNMATVAGLAAGIGMAAPAMAPIHNPSPYSRQKMLNAIEQVESSGGKNVNHKPTSHGVAYGKFALMPDTIQETIHMNPDLRSKYGKALHLKGQDLHRFMQDNPDLESKVAEQHLARLEHHFGQDPQKLGFSWNQGITGTNKAIKQKEDINSSPYVQKIKQAYKGSK